MAKKIFTIASEVSRASNALKDFQIEHVVATYPAHKDKPAHSFIVVLNKGFEDAKIAIKEAGVSIIKTKNARHFERLALSQMELNEKAYFVPKFQCKCRHCGKTFTSRHKEAAWCSDKCYKDFRNAKKTCGNQDKL